MMLYVIQGSRSEGKIKEVFESMTPFILTLVWMIAILTHFP
ncbi:hypothetical protein [Uliginosibacterium sp. TH139]|nr:hypothetical protein [Uliginosibacterium sp. TH139]